MKRQPSPPRRVSTQRGAESAFARPHKPGAVSPRGKELRVARPARSQPTCRFVTEYEQARGYTRRCHGIRDEATAAARSMTTTPRRAASTSPPREEKSHRPTRPARAQPTCRFVTENEQARDYTRKCHGTRDEATAAAPSTTSRRRAAPAFMRPTREGEEPWAGSIYASATGVALHHRIRASPRLYAEVSRNPC